MDVCFVCEIDRCGPLWSGHRLCFPADGVWSSSGGQRCCLDAHRSLGPRRADGGGCGIRDSIVRAELGAASTTPRPPFC